MSNLSRRVTVAVVGITSAVVLVAAGGLWVATRSVLLDSVDRELNGRSERMKRIDSLSSPEAWRRPPNFPSEQRNRSPRGFPTDPRFFIQVFDVADGKEVHRSSALPADVDLAAAGDRQPSSETPWSATLSNGSHVRLLAFTKHRVAPAVATEPATLAPTPSPTPTPSVAPSGESPPPVTALPMTPTTSPTAASVVGVIIYVGIDLEQVDGELSRMAVVLAAVWAAATVLAFASIALLRPAILRPARNLAGAITRLGPDDLAARIPANAAPDEMRGITECLNGLLDRLEQAFRREQATIANIAHELRTPVATLRTALEFRLLAAAAPAEREWLDGCLATVERMQAQVSNLLLLARIEAGKEPLLRSEADLADLASEAVERWEERARARGQRIVSLGDEGVRVDTSPDHLGLVLDNLLGNAVAYGNEGGEISVTVRVVDGQAVLAVVNAFTGELDADQLGHAYYRGDTARHADDHSGLGLALCHRLCRLLSAKLSLRVSDGRFTAEVVMAPAANPAQSG